MGTNRSTSELDALPRVGRARIRDGILVEVDDDMAAVLGRARDELIGLHFTTLIDGDDVARVSARYVLRLRDEAVPSSYETSIRLPDGTARVVEVHIEKRGDDVVVAALDVTARAARSARLFALSALVVAAQRERDAGAVVAHTMRGLAALDMTAVLLRPAGDGPRGALRREAIAVPPALDSIAPGLADDTPGARWTPLVETAWAEGAAWSDDGPKEIAAVLGLSARIVARIGDRMIFRAACMRIDADGVPWAMLFTLAGWPRSDDLPALRLFVAQLGGALDNVRAIARLSRRNAELAALDRLVTAAGRSTDFDEFVAAALREVVGAVDATGVRLYRLDAPTGAPVLLADERGVVGAAARAATAPRAPRDAGAPTAEIPLSFRSEPAALLRVDFARGRDVGAAEIALLGAMGAHLVSAMEHHALLRDLRGRVDELTLLRDVAVASAELDARRLFESALPRVAATLRADEAYGWMLETDGALLLQGHFGAPTGTAERVARLAAGEGLPGEAVARLGTVALASARTLAPGAPPGRPALFALNQAVAVPLVVGKDRAVGAVLLGRTSSTAFSERECELAEAVAAELAVALERARLYEDLRRSYVSLEHAQERLVQRERLAALGELAAIVAHEVRNPLGVLFNAFGSLRRMLRPEGEVATLVDIMDEEAVRLNRIVSDLLDFARPIAPTRAPEPIDRVLDEAVQVALTTIDPAAVRVERDLEPDLLLVPIDARMLRQAVINLVLNALQAMPDGGTLRVHARNDRAGVVVEIGDTGVGMAGELREKIFEPFFTTKARGSGLGLVVVRRIVEAHRGTVQVESEPGRGTTFSVFLPRSDDEPVEHASPSQAASQSSDDRRPEARGARS